MQWLFDLIRAEWATVVKAPVLLIVVLALGAGLGWLGASAFYQQDLQTLRDTIQGLEAKPSPAASALATQTVASPMAASASATPQASPTNVFLGLGGQVTPLYALVDKLGWPKNRIKLKEIWGQTYVRTTVPLDGYIYYNTTFDNVTFVYDGKLPSGGWVNSQITGAAFFSNNPAIKNTVILLQSLNVNPALGCGMVPPAPRPLIK